jgi:3-oxoacyl-[acyl-carrier protein] reductase
MNILITGDSKGIGKYLSEYYLEKGNTVLGCSRSEVDLKNKNYEHFIVDITKEKDINNMVSKIRKKYGYVDVLINNAGIASMNHFLLTPTKTAKKIMDVNYFGTLVMSREISKLMRKSKQGRIVNFTTVAKPLHLDGESVYASSKAAVETLTKILAKELAKYKITVNAIGPTPVKTDLIKGVSQEKINNLIKSQAIERFAELSDISNLIDFFIDDKSEFITGQIIYLGGIS